MFKTKSFSQICYQNTINLLKLKKNNLPYITSNKNAIILNDIIK